MEFRPCIDIHDGYVKQIVGSSLSDTGKPTENFVSDRKSSYFAGLYKERGLKGGHVIILNKAGTAEYELSKNAAFEAFKEYPNGLQTGGGINAENAYEFIEKGASHVIVTSFLFDNGKLSFEKMNILKNAVGKEHIVFDLSCKKVGNEYFVTTDRWQTVTDCVMDLNTLRELELYCDEFLIHAVDVEGKSNGPEKDILKTLSKYSGNPITYAGGIHSYSDIEEIAKSSDNRINITIGSALDIFGGHLSFDKVCGMCR